MADPLRLAVRLTPKAAQDKVHGWTSDTDGQKILKVSVTAVPEKGKANKALVALLAKHLKIPKSAITIIRGETDRNKILLMDGADETAFTDIN